jgi:cytoplasmic tRNA 2-thiolation protein 2
LPLVARTGTALERLESIAHLPMASRPALLEHILLSLLHRVAATESASHILLGETSTREAQRIIAGTALGRGWALPLELSPLLDRGAARLKPMKEITVKEAAVYCHLEGVRTVNERRWATGRGKAPSLEALTERECARGVAEQNSSRG